LMYVILPRTITFRSWLRRMHIPPTGEAKANDRAG
jgi:hypothetical protein